MTELNELSILLLKIFLSRQPHWKQATVTAVSWGEPRSICEKKLFKATSPTSTYRFPAKPKSWSAFSVASAIWSNSHRSCGFDAVFIPRPNKDGAGSKGVLGIDLQRAYKAIPI